MSRFQYLERVRHRTFPSMISSVAATRDGPVDIKRWTMTLFVTFINLGDNVSDLLTGNNFWIHTEGNLA